jgi:hypothetical protein
MANILQAAKWIEDGFMVQRKEFKDVPNDKYQATDGGEIVSQDFDELVFTLGDLLAEDWEIAG